MNERIAFLFMFALNASATSEPNLLSVNVLDESGNPLPCRVWVDVDGNRHYQPQSPPECTPYERDRSFSCPGYFSIEVPAGKTRVHVEKGKEYLPADVLIPDVSQNQPVSIRLRRWINMPEESWYSTDMHVHSGVGQPEVLRQLALADDVHLTPVFTYWLRGDETTWPEQWPESSAGGDRRIDPTHIVTLRNVEIERIRSTSPPGGSVGASFLFNLSKPVSTVNFGEHFPTDTTLCLTARRHSPQVVIDTDKPSWAETVVGVALGAYDTVQVCHNHYHREQDIAGGWGMIAPLAPGESNASEGDGLFHRTNNLYYRFLNCGFRLGVSGGSAIGVMPVPMGYNRVYAQIEGELSGKKLWEAVKKGRTFATSGPMLELSIDGSPPGSVLKLSSKKLAVKARVRSIDRLEVIQMIQDGKVTGSVDLTSIEAEPYLDQTVRWNIQPKRSGWIAARVLFRNQTGNLRQAHTSPVYLDLEGKPVAYKKDAQYMIRWIEELVKIANQDGRFPARSDRERLLRVYDRARSLYENVSSRAESDWGD